MRHQLKPPPPAPGPALQPAADAPHRGDDGAGLTDHTLAVRAAEGDEDAFALLVRRHSSRLLALALHLLGNRADAEDAVQEAFLSAWRQLPGFRHGSSFGTWMYRIVTNRSLNILRCRHRPEPLDALSDPPASDARSSPPRIAEADAATAALVRALLQLNPDLRVCWVLRELHGLHYEEIARLVGVGEKTVRGRLFRARRALMEAMSPWR
ncbi:RNA polymerase sigma factor [Streptomyces sp. cmx-4-9]|uniref:RNA polymerase sigma factor n=1 Tax=Streptomyces sp. cmx-4-9 TaxID=2790941 RepID=UPI0039804BA2